MLCCSTSYDFSAVANGWVVSGDIQVPAAFTEVATSLAVTDGGHTLIAGAPKTTSGGMSTGGVHLFLSNKDPNTGAGSWEDTLKWVWPNPFAR